MEDLKKVIGINNFICYFELELTYKNDAIYKEYV